MTDKEKSDNILQLELEGLRARNAELENLLSVKSQEDILHNNAGLFRTLIDSGQALIWTSGTDMKCDYFNRPWLEFTGRTLEQELGDGWVEGVHPDDLERCVEKYTDSFKRRERFSIEYRIRRYDGEFRWIQDDGSPRYDSQGAFLGYMGHCLDINENKAIHEELKAKSYALNERMKELNCLYSISRIIETPSISLDETLLRIVDLIPPGWQYPSITCSRMTLNKLTYATPNYIDTPWKLSSPIYIHESLAGYLEVCYIKERPNEYEGPFLKEERDLLDALSERLSKMISRKYTEEAFQKSEERYRTTLMGIGDGVITTDADGNVELLNPVAEQLTGWPLSEAQGKPLEAVLHLVNEYTRKPVDNPVSEVVRKGIVVGLANHTILIARDGSEKPIADSGAPILDINGRLTGVVLVFRDQSEERKAQKAIAASEEKFRSLAENSEDYIMRFDSKFRHIYENPAGLRISGLSEQDVIGKTHRDLGFDKELCNLWEEKIKYVFETGETTRLQFEWESIEGKVYLDLHLTPEFTEDGQVESVLGVSRDITALKKTENDLRRNKELLQTIIDSIPAPVFYKDVNGIYTGCNVAFTEYIGITRENIIGKTAFDITPVEYASAYHEADLILMKEKQTQIYDASVLYQDGFIRQVMFHKAPFYDENGEIVGIVGAMLDVTERKLAEDALRQSEEKHRILLEESSDPIFSFTPEGQYKYVNRAFANGVGMTVENITGKSLWDIFPKEDADKRYEALSNVFLTGNEEVIEVRDGNHYYISTITPIKNNAGKVVFAIGSSKDITRQKKAEEALRESEGHVRAKLDAILSPEGNISSIEFADIIDIPSIQLLMDEFSRITHITIALVDLQDKILVAAGWQDICTKFHRIHPETAQNCKESDTNLSKYVEHGSYRIYRCKNNMLDVVTPIIVGGVHLCNLFIGQFIYDDEVLDYELFRNQANLYGFDEKEYIAAYERVPRWSREIIEKVMNYLTRFAELISNLSYSNIKLARTLTERNNLADSLQESRSMLRLVLDTVPQSIFWKDLNSMYLGCNQVFADNVGIDSPEGIIGKTDFDLTWPKKEAEAYRADDEFVMSTNTPKLHILEQVQKIDGTRIWVDTNKLPLLDENGNVYGVLGVFDNITERKQAEETLRENEALVKSVLDNLPVGVAVNAIDPSVNFNYLNDNFLKYYRTTREKLTGEDSFWEAVYEDPEFREKIKVNILDDCAQGKPELMHWEDVPITRKGERTTFISARNIPINDKKLMISIVWDVTENKIAEESLRHSEAFLNSIIEHSPHAMWISDNTGTLIRLNQSCRNLLNITDDDVVGKYNLLQDNIVEQQGFIPLVKEVYEKGKTVKFSLKYDSSQLKHLELRDTKFVILDVTISPVLDSQGKVANAIIQHVDITERIVAGEALKETERVKSELLERLNEAQQIAIIGSWEWNLQNNQVWWSDETYRIFGVNHDDFVPSFESNARLIHPDDVDMYRKSFENTLKTGVPLDLTIRINTRDGILKHCHAIGKIIYDNSDQPLRVTGTLMDVTELKRAEIFQNLSNEILGILNSLSELPEAINRILTLIKIITEFDAVGIRLKDNNDFPYLVQSGFSADFLSKENTLINRGVSGTICRDNDGEISLECTCGLIISGKADLSQPFFTPGGSFWTNNSIPLLDIPADKDPRLHPRNNCIHEGYCSVALIPIRADGNIVGLLQLNDRKKDCFTLDMILFFEGICSSIGMALMRKRAEENLRLSVERWNTTFDSISDIVSVISKEHVFLEINKAGCEAIGLQKEQIIGRKCFELLHGTNTSIALCPCEETLRTHKYVKKLYEDNGRYYELSSWPTHQNLDDYLSFVHIVKDITEQVISEREKTKLENQLIQAQKMESVGRLAGGVAHDFNNLLTVILANSEMALMSLESGLSVREEIGEIKSASERAADLTRQLLAFARKQTITPKVLDLNDTIAGMLKMLRRLIGEDIELIWKPGPNLWPVKVDPSQVDQILANLSVNARDAISNVGNLSIETENVIFDETYCGAHSGIVPGEYVMLAVSDTGSGMDTKTLEQLFEPFFTTKETGKGTGLGLATVYGAVKQNNGYINVYSEPGKGTTFKIYLPHVLDELAEEKGTLKKKPERGNETVILAEDEANILKLSKNILESFGYTVIAAQTPKEILTIAENYDGPIHLLITDVVMPGMNGRELRDKLAVYRPGIKTLFMSGYTANVIAHHGVIDAGIHFLQKPFSGNTLAKKVRETLDS